MESTRRLEAESLFRSDVDVFVICYAAEAAAYEQGLAYNG